MVPTRFLSAPDEPRVGPMNLAIRVVMGWYTWGLSGPRTNNGAITWKTVSRCREMRLCIFSRFRSRSSLQSYQNERHGVSNHRHLDCLLSLCSGALQIKHQISASLAFMRGTHRWPVDSPHKGPVMRKVLPFGNVIMYQLVIAKRDI